MSTHIRMLLFLVVGVQTAVAQEVIFGTNNYVEYQVGTLPIVISVPHGGGLEPLTIPDRTCNDPVLVTDAFTVETALEIKHALFNTTGCYPHLIICHLKRTKLDCNRNIVNGACGNGEAETAWNEFHGFIKMARDTANQQFDFHTFFVDLHGHGNPIQRIELGYLLYENELELPDSVLNTTQYINYSSIKNLALSNANNYTHSALLRGDKAFGTLLANQNYPAVPSEQVPFPGINSNYFSGGYITANHTCNEPGVDINGLQMELNYNGIRNNASNRIQFSNGFTNAIMEYLNTHFDMDWTACSPPASHEPREVAAMEFRVLPNPVRRGDAIHLEQGGNGATYYEVLSLTGVKLMDGTLDGPDGSIHLNNMGPGMYLIKTYHPQSDRMAVARFIIE